MFSWARAVLNLHHIYRKYSLPVLDCCAKIRLARFGTDLDLVLCSWNSFSHWVTPNDWYFLMSFHMALCFYYKVLFLDALFYIIGWVRNLLTVFVYVCVLAQGPGCVSLQTVMKSHLAQVHLMKRKWCLLSLKALWGIRVYTLRPRGNNSLVTLENFA